MAQTNVSSCVLSIVASFSSGLDVFKQLREKRMRKRSFRTDAKLNEEEVRLVRSLRQGPEDIGREYQKNIQAAGDQFALGDAIAQTSLAEILLKLNTGLVSIITAFLNRDKKGMQLDYQSLTELSERSRSDTCRTLRQLFRRMSQMKALNDRQLASQGSTNHEQESTVAGEKRKRKAKTSVKHTKKVERPMLARIVIEGSSKPSQVALVKPGERRRKSSSSKTSSETASTSSTPLSSPPPYSSQVQLARPVPDRSHTVPQVPKARRKPSTATMKDAPLSAKADALRATRSTPRLQDTGEPKYEVVPPMPSRRPLDGGELARRKPTPTYYSIASDTTKLGEIPLHKWAQPFDFDAMSLMNREAAVNGWPANQLEDGKRKRFGLFRLFRRKEATL